MKTDTIKISQWLSLTCFVAILLVVEMEKEIVLPAIPDMMKDFQVGYAMTQVILSVNFLGFAVSCLTCFGLIKILGYARVTIMACCGFNVGSFLACTKTSLLCLIVGRFLQGLSGGYLCIIFFALLPICFEREKADRLVGVVNGVIFLTTGLAPMIGVFLVESYGWHACFLCVLVLGLSALVGLPWAQKMTTTVVLPSAKSSSLFASFKVLLKSPEFLMAASMPALMLSCYLVYVAYASFLFQNILGEHSGGFFYIVAQMGVMVGFAAFCFSSGFLCQRYQSKKVERFFSCLSIICGFLLILSLFYAEQYPWYVVVSSILTFAFQGVPFNNAMARAVRVVPSLETEASSLAMFLKLFTSAMFLSCVSFVGNSPLEGTVIVLIVLFTLTLYPVASRSLYTIQGAESDGI